MLCSKCYKKIPEREEIQIESSIICKECALNGLVKEKIVGKCHRCFKLIYKDEMIHEVCENWGAENSEKLIKCQSCYEKWLGITELKRKTWKLTRWFDNVFLPFSMWFVLAIITVNKNEEHIGKGPVLIMLMLSTSIMLLSPLFLNFILFIYRKILERKYNKKKRKTK